jgi:hypothetical protein
MQKDNLTFREWFLLSEIDAREADNWKNFEKGLKEYPENLRFNHIFGNKDRIVIPYGKDKDILKQIENQDNVKIDWANKKVTQKTVTQQGEKDQVIKLGRFLQNLINKSPNNQDYKQLLRIFETGQEVPKPDKLPESVVISRKPIDIVRMSDFEDSSSCHSPNRGYWKSAQSEARTGGIVSYLVNTDDLEGVDLDADEIFEDKCRGVRGIKPIERIRLRSFTVNDKKILVPETKVYLREKSGSHVNDKYYNVMRSWATENNHDVGDFDKNLSKVTLHGGVSDSSSENILSKYFNIPSFDLVGKVRGEDTDETNDQSDVAISTMSQQELANRIRGNWEDHNLSYKLQLIIVPSTELPNEFVEKLTVNYQHCFPLNSIKLLIPASDFPILSENVPNNYLVDKMDELDQILNNLLDYRSMNNLSPMRERFALTIEHESLCFKLSFRKGRPDDQTADLQEAERFFDAMDIFDRDIEKVPDILLKALESADIIESKSIIQKSADIKVRHSRSTRNAGRSGYGSAYNDAFKVEVPPILVGDLYGLVNKQGGFSVPSNIFGTQEDLFYRNIKFDNSGETLKSEMTILVEEKLELARNDATQFPNMKFDVNLDIAELKTNSPLIKKYYEDYSKNPKARLPEIKIELELQFDLHPQTDREGFDSMAAFKSLEKFVQILRKDLPNEFNKLKQKALRGF